ncbi:hypothetical protein [Paenibacillus dendrobii]|uniref:hypothetical protein n=1 Tax=Paenibacillus dendrobii TaxID=2691084 RepID=UPI00136D6016|nr:hypothetical protein [Paenibacillus dendrobii]
MFAALGLYYIYNNSVSDGKQDEETKSIAEFFIMRKWRKQGIGREVATRIFDRHKGNWEVKQEKENYNAQKFWETVINQYCNGRYTKKESLPKWDGPIIFFKN